MQVFKGKGVCDAVAVGKALVIKDNNAAVERKTAQDPVKELERVEKAKEQAVRELSQIHEKALESVGEADAEIFEIHIMMLDDEDFNDSIKDLIENEGVNAEYAVYETSETLSRMFSEMDDDYMRARAADIKDISNRLIACLRGGDTLSDADDDTSVICASDLTPSRTVQLDKSKVLAFVTAKGTDNSHTAILARNMNIPAVISVGDEFLSAVRNGDIIAVDGHIGEVFISPDEETTERLRKKQEADDKRRQLLLELRGKENITRDGRKIEVFANIGGLNEMDLVSENDAGGIGLFRSESIFLGRDDIPDEEEQFSIYRRVLEKAEGKKVIIRTLDIGADKQVDYLDLDKEENPALGVRGIRLCLTRPELFRTQLRALFRASVYGSLGIMFPMIISTSEVQKCLDICDDVKSELRSEGSAWSEDTEIGIMIETPAAALISDKLADMVDFFSIGTNDLTQYTLACDRQNPGAGIFIDTHHEAVLKLIEMTVANAHPRNVWVGICGELGADLDLTETFIRIGIDELSVSPSMILPLRERIRSI